MDASEVRQIVEAAQVALEPKLELKVMDRIGKAEKELSDRVDKTETRLQMLQQIAYLIAGLAVTFGLSGAWGLKLLIDAERTLGVTKSRVESLSADAKKLETEVDNIKLEAELNVDQLKKLRTEQIAKFHEDAEREETTAMSDLLKKISSLNSSSDIQARSVTILNSDGKAVVSLSAGQVGGVVQTFNSASGKNIGELGATADGDGAIWLFNRAGQNMLVGDSSGAGGDWIAFNRRANAIADLGATEDGDGSLIISNKEGLNLLLGIASGPGGIWEAESSVTSKNVAILGSGNAGDGGLWLFDKQGNTIAH